MLLDEEEALMLLTNNSLNLDIGRDTLIESQRVHVDDGLLWKQMRLKVEVTFLIAFLILLDRNGTENDCMKLAGHHDLN